MTEPNGNKVIYSCKEHIETALDDFINFEGKAPTMNIILPLSDIKCSYCVKKAEYELLP